MKWTVSHSCPGERVEKGQAGLQGQLTGREQLQLVLEEMVEYSLMADEKLSGFLGVWPIAEGVMAGP